MASQWFSSDPKFSEVGFVLPPVVNEVHYTKEKWAHIYLEDAVNLN